MDPEASIVVKERVDLSFNNNDNDRGIIVVECKQRRVKTAIAGNNGTYRCDSITILFPLHSPTDVLGTCRLSNDSDLDPDGHPFGVGAAVLLDYSHLPSDFEDQRNVDIVCNMLAQTMHDCDARDDGMRSAISKNARKRRIVAYVFPEEKTCNNRLFNDGVAATDDYKVVLHRAAATSKFSDRQDLPDQLTPFVAIEVAIDRTDEVIRNNDIEYAAPLEYMAKIHKMNGKKLYFLFY